MRVLVLTPISPVLAGDVYSRLSSHFNKEKRDIDFICYPYFAELRANQMDNAFLPTFFSMIKVMQDPKVKKRVYTYDNTIVIGNTFKTEKFDVVVAFDEMDGEVFDKYLKELELDEDLKEFREKVDVKNLYSLEDASVVLPTMQHLKLFLEGVFKNEPK